MNLAKHWRREREARPFAANTVITAVANLVIAVFGMVTGIVSARLLGPHGRGELAAIQTTPSFIATLAMLGLPEALTYYCAQHREEAGRYLGTASLVAFAASVPFVVMGYLAMPLLLRAQSSSVINAARCYLLIAPVWAVVGILLHVMRGIGDFTTWNVARLMVPVLAVCVLAAAWAFNHPTPRFVAFGYLASYAILFIPWLRLLRPRIPELYRADASKVTAMLRYGLPCVLTGVPQILNLRLDQMLMAAFLPSRELGLYVAAVAWSAAPAPLLSALGAVTTPAVASAASAAEGSARLAGTLRATAALALVLGGTLTLCTPIAIALLFGPAFAASIHAAMVLVPAAGVLGINLVLQEGLRGLGRPYAVLHAEVCGLIVTAIALAVMMRPMGIMGAAIASLLGYTAVSVVLLLKTRQATSLPLITLLYPDPEEIQTALVRLAGTVKHAVALKPLKQQELREET